MKYIYDQLGDWYLSMAGYDWGTGNIQHAVQKTGYADFWELYKRNNLPAETKNYVPEILAAIIIANHPTQYGFDDITLDPPVLTDTVTINYSVDLRLVSDLVGAPVDELIALNPSLLRLVTPPDTTFDLHLPAGTAALFQEQDRLHPRKQAQLLALSSASHPTTRSPPLPTPTVFLQRDRCRQPARRGRQTRRRRGPRRARRPVRRAFSAHRLYTTRRGDTLVSIADRFGVSLTQLRRWNKLPSSSIKIEAGHRLHVAEPTLARASISHSRHGKGKTGSAHEIASASSPAGELPPARTPLTQKRRPLVTATQLTPARPHRRNARTARVPRSIRRAQNPQRRRKSNSMRISLHLF